MVVPLPMPPARRSDEFPQCCSELEEGGLSIEQENQAKQQISQFWRRTRTQSSIDWSVAPSQRAHEALKTIDVSDIVNEIISDRQTWYSDTANPLTLFFHRSVGDGIRYLEKYTARDQDSNPPWPPREIVLNSNGQFDGDSIDKIPHKIMTPVLVVAYKDSQKGTVFDDYINP